MHVCSFFFTSITTYKFNCASLYFCVFWLIACFFACPSVFFFYCLFIYLLSVFTLCPITLACEWVLRVSSAFRAQQWFIGDCYFRNLIRLRSGRTALSNGMVRRHWRLPITHCFTPWYHKRYPSTIAFSSHFKSTLLRVINSEIKKMTREAIIKRWINKILYIHTYKYKRKKKKQSLTMWIFFLLLMSLYSDLSFGHGGHDQHS